MSDPGRYAVLCDGTVLNVILWDGETVYDPGVNCTLKLLPEDSPVSAGWTRAANGRWVRPAETDVPAADPVPLVIDPAAFATFLQAVTDPDVDTRQALTDFAAALDAPAP